MVGAGGASTLSVDQSLVTRATLGVSHPSLTGRASSGAHASGVDALGRVGADALSGVGSVLLLAIGATDGLVTGPTAGAAHFVAQNLSTRASGGTVTLSVGGTGAGKSAALRGGDRKEVSKAARAQGMKQGKVDSRHHRNSWFHEDNKCCRFANSNLLHTERPCRCSYRQSWFRKGRRNLPCRCKWAGHLEG